MMLKSKAVIMVMPTMLQLLKRNYNKKRKIRLRKKSYLRKLNVGKKLSTL